MIHGPVDWRPGPEKPKISMVAWVFPRLPTGSIANNINSLNVSRAMPLEQKPVFDDDDLDSYFLHRYDPSKRPEDAGDKLGRELGVIFGGTADAFKSAVSKENAVGTIAETALAVAGGAAIKAAEARFPALRPALAIAGAATTFSFVKDLALNFKEISGIMADNWNNKDHQEANRKAFATHGGKFGLDLALSMGGGLAGSVLAERTMFNQAKGYMRVPLFQSMELESGRSVPRKRLMSLQEEPAKVLSDARPSALYIDVDRPKKSFYGSGFLISEDGLAVTNHHVVEGARSIIAHDSRGYSFKTTVLAVNKERDLAVLQLHRRDPATRFQPARLAEQDPEAGSKLFMLSKVDSDGPVTVSPGQVMGKTVVERAAAESSLGEQAAQPSAQPDYRPNYPPEMFSTKTGPYGLGDYYSRPGFSGSAVFDASGAVVGVHAGRKEADTTKLVWTRFAPVSALRDLLPEAQAALKASAEAAEKVKGQS